MVQVAEAPVAGAAPAALNLPESDESLTLGLSALCQAEFSLSRFRKKLEASEIALAASLAREVTAVHRSLHDGATGLPNRELFDDRVAQAIALADRHQWTLAILFIDLDHFKAINDTYGHDAGDEVLKETARRLQRQIRFEDTVCRCGGDEFLLLMINPCGVGNIEKMVVALQESVGQPIDVGRIKILLRASIGIAVYPENGKSGQQLIRNADAAMYRAKIGPGGHIFF